MLYYVVVCCFAVHFAVFRSFIYRKNASRTRFFRSSSAGYRNRTGTSVATRGILSPVRLPVPPSRLVQNCCTQAAYCRPLPPSIYTTGILKLQGESSRSESYLEAIWKLSGSYMEVIVVYRRAMGISSSCTVTVPGEPVPDGMPGQVRFAL